MMHQPIETEHGDDQIASWTRSDGALAFYNPDGTADEVLFCRNPVDLRDHA